MRLLGKMSAGFKSAKVRNRPSRRPEAGVRGDFEAFPIMGTLAPILPWSLSSGPEARSRHTV